MVASVPSEETITLAPVVPVMVKSVLTLVSFAVFNAIAVTLVAISVALVAILLVFVLIAVVLAEICVLLALIASAFTFACASNLSSASFNAVAPAI